MKQDPSRSFRTSFRFSIADFRLGEKSHEQFFDWLFVEFFLPLPLGEDRGEGA
jgi:hypothetical protein